VCPVERLCLLLRAPGHSRMQRMATLACSPGVVRLPAAVLIAGSLRTGSKSWRQELVDRHGSGHFQSPATLSSRIRNGALDGQGSRDVAYQATPPTSGVRCRPSGGPQPTCSGGRAGSTCGKAEPGPSRFRLARKLPGVLRAGVRDPEHGEKVVAYHRRTAFPSGNRSRSHAAGASKVRRTKKRGIAEGDLHANPCAGSETTRLTSQRRSVGLAGISPSSPSSQATGAERTQPATAAWFPGPVSCPTRSGGGVRRCRSTRESKRGVQVPPAPSHYYAAK